MSRLTLLALCFTSITAFAADTASPTPSAPTATPTAAPATGVLAPGPKITWSSAHVDGPYIAMTFDDGPHITNTPRLLDILAKHHIKATFFLIGENAERYPEIVKRIVAEGHVIGNHSWTHPELSKLSEENVHSELQKTDDAIFKAVGFHPKLMRPPYGALTPIQRRWVNQQFGYKIILWDVDPEDWKYRNAEHVETEILKQTTNGSIILSHDIHVTTVDAMDDTLTKLEQKGFKFVTVPELIEMDKPLPPKTPAPAKPKSSATASPAAPATTATPTPPDHL